LTRYDQSLLTGRNAGSLVGVNYLERLISRQARGILRCANARSVFQLLSERARHAGIGLLDQAVKLISDAD
jgi:hypothetical protein